MRGYRFAVKWIAANDESGADDRMDASVVSGYISTLLIADLFEKDPARVAGDVIRERKWNERV